MNYGLRPVGHRLPADTRIGQVCVQVRDVDRSLEFYGGLLGFAVLERTSTSARIGVGKEVLIELRVGASRARMERRLGLYHFAILLPDRHGLGGCLRQLLDRGVHPGASDHLVSEALYIQDPDGLGIELYWDRPRESWRVNGDQLAMASDPLDLDSLIAEAEGSGWRGMPQGTRIGHIHLHVGDLDGARDFYHQGLGFDLIVWSYPGALFMSAGNYHHHLGVNTWAGPLARPAPSAEAQLLWWDLLLPSTDAIEGVVRSLADRAYTVTGEGLGAGQLARDPWGTTVRLTTAV